jgi:plastocyanin
MLARCCLALTASLLLAATATRADLTIPGADGSDGSLHVTENTAIDLGLATEGVPGTDAWSADNTANAGNGVYDPDQWAVVFKYASVTVDAGATLSFINHPSRAPVVWLVSGDVTVDGTLSVNGAIGIEAPALAEPGPGGFRGGAGYYTSGVGASSGLGFGGGIRGGESGAGGTYATGPDGYGNPSDVPMLGGSGGGGDGNHNRGGGGGAGALLIASSGLVTVNGNLTADGGPGIGSGCCTGGSGGGSGGAIRVVADTLAGDGIITALGGAGANGSGAGGVGRVRIEYVADDGIIQVIPDPSVVPLVSGSQALIWPPAGAPTARILSIGDAAVDEDPRASFGTTGADAVLPEVTTTQVLIETVNVEEASQVEVRMTPRADGSHAVVDAVMAEVISSNPLTLHWVADIPLGVGYSAIQAKVIRP